jgi:hypothetical protein
MWAKSRFPVPRPNGGVVAAGRSGLLRCYLPLRPPCACWGTPPTAWMAKTRSSSVVGCERSKVARPPGRLDGAGAPFVAWRSRSAAHNTAVLVAIDQRGNLSHLVSGSASLLAVTTSCRLAWYGSSVGNKDSRWPSIVARFFETTDHRLRADSVVSRMLTHSCTEDAHGFIRAPGLDKRHDKGDYHGPGRVAVSNAGWL